MPTWNINQILIMHKLISKCSFFYYLVPLSSHRQAVWMFAILTFRKRWWKLSGFLQKGNKYLQRIVLWTFADNQEKNYFRFPLLLLTAKTKVSGNLSKNSCIWKYLYNTWKNCPIPPHITEISILLPMFILGGTSLWQMGRSLGGNCNLYN